jgi:hypothetical protein
MVGLALLAVLLHALALPVDRLESASDQVQVFRPTWWPAGFTVAIELLSLSGAERGALTRMTSDGRQ